VDGSKAYGNKREEVLQRSRSEPYGSTTGEHHTQEKREEKAKGISLPFMRRPKSSFLLDLPVRLSDLF
jgi:hypothetical protein